MGKQSRPKAVRFRRPGSRHRQVNRDKCALWNTREPPGRGEGGGDSASLLERPLLLRPLMLLERLPLALLER